MLRARIYLDFVVSSFQCGAGQPVPSRRLRPRLGMQLVAMLLQQVACLVGALSHYVGPSAAPRKFPASRPVLDIYLKENPPKSLNSFSG